MNTWDEKLQIQLFRACSLESCVALADTCQAFRNLVTADNGVMQRKVTDRVPWINQASKSWLKDARMICNRTRKAVSGTGWTPITAVDTKTGKAKKRAISDFPKADKTRKAVVPCFEAAYKVKNGAEVRDATIVFGNSTWDIRNASSGTNTQEEETGSSRAPEHVTLVSGEQAEVVQSNDSLVHLKLDDKECLVHQSLRNCVTVAQFQKSDKIVFKLFDGDRGALMLHRVDSITPYIAYIEPTVELKRVVICNVPAWTCNSLQFLFHDGFLVLYFSGRFVRLWVDLGYQKRVHFLADFREVLGFDKLAQISDTRALCATQNTVANNLNFEGYTGSCGVGKPIMGSAESEMSRYVSLEEAQGKCVGDLVTGQAWFAVSTDIVVPADKEGKLVFHAVKTVPDETFKPVFEAVEGEAENGNETSAGETPAVEPLKTPSNVGSAFFDDSTAYVPYAELKLHTAPFTKPELTKWDVSDSEKYTRDYYIRPGTVLFTKKGAIKHPGRDKSGKVMKKKPAKRREMVFTRR